MRSLPVPLPKSTAPQSKPVSRVRVWLRSKVVRRQLLTDRGRIHRVGLRAQFGCVPPRVGYWRLGMVGGLLNPFFRMRLGRWVRRLL